MIKRHNITIFTPTYNRIGELAACYESLVAQTNPNFTWMIIDDGSTDETEQIVEHWQKSGKILIEYYKKVNGGKHTAYNFAINLCKTDYFLFLDSDDTLVPECIEILDGHIDKIFDKSKISGIIGLWSSTDKTSVARMPVNVENLSGIELNQKYGFAGETVRMYKTNILKEYVFPIFPKEKFIYENVIFEPIDSKYKMLIVNKILARGKFLEGGYTSGADKLKVNNPKGYALSLDTSVKYALSVRKKINWTILYIIWSHNFKNAGGYKMFSSKLMYLTIYPLAMVLEMFKQPRFFFRILEKKNKLGNS